MKSARELKYGWRLADAYKAIAAIKWTEEFYCSKCGHDKYFEGKFPYSRRCLKCKKDTSPTAGTFFEGIRFPLHIALYIINEMAKYSLRPSSLELAERILVKFNHKLRSKTIWDFLIKLYTALDVPEPEFSGDVTIIKFNQGGKTILAANGYINDQHTYIAYVENTEGFSLLQKHITSNEVNNPGTRAFEVTFRKEVRMEYGKRVISKELSSVKGITGLPTNDYGASFSIDISEAIAGITPKHFQAYLNLYWFKQNVNDYRQLLFMLANNKIRN